ncbi:MAG: 3-methyl-2-oxobutanoate hydroxymethyltransferase [Candidatus Latescibacteria bacterium]|nr:3-methyl-2-oxobutanoate hydroxymethyltransferase [bacterium]MBD3423320.1 3-methyl-2-oxobutanoate hydroxymethyltransferase [Candidatus Latescibacterota bacterium]
MPTKVTGKTLKSMKKKGEKIAAITSYDYLTTRMLDDTDIDFILVGDSLGQVMLGYGNTLPVTMDEVIHHLRAVTRAQPRAFVAADMPFMSFQAGVEEAVRNAGRLVKEGGAEGVKLEGGKKTASAIERIVEVPIPVVGHIGLTPQSLHQFGGYRVQGRDKDSARMLIEDAMKLEEAGCCCIVVEGVPWQVAEEITGSIKIPTIGIGAGKYCDGQILVIQDMLGINEGELPRFVKKYENIGERMKSAVSEYIREVKEGRFPEMEHSYSANKHGKPRR